MIEIKLLIDKKGRKIFAAPGEIHTNKGVIELKGPEEIVKSHLGEEYIVLDPDLLDIYEKMPRSGSFMVLKDIGLILSHLGIGSGQSVVDAGTGSGALTLFIAHAVGSTGHIYTYEKNPEFARNSRGNIEKAGFEKRVTLYNQDISEGFNEEDASVDIVTLDLHESWKHIQEVKRILRRGGRTAIYTPYIEHAKLVNNELIDHDFIEIKTLETIQREIEFRAQGTRPKTTPLGHSAYITFGRRT